MILDCRANIYCDEDVYHSLPEQSLIVMARYPVSGQVKTRLEPVLGQAGCAALQRALLEDTLRRVSSLSTKRYLFLAGCTQRDAEKLVRKWSLYKSWKVHLQQGVNLGARMWSAYCQVSRGEPVVFLGTDAPNVPLDYLRDAFKLLSHKAVVVGPVVDGGYYLLGLSEPHPELFSGITWGSDQVLQQTVEKLDRSEYALLPEWYDVDLEADLNRLACDLDEYNRCKGFPQATWKFLQTFQPKRGQ